MTVKGSLKSDAERQVVHRHCLIPLLRLNIFLQRPAGHIIQLLLSLKQNRQAVLAGTSKEL